MDLSDLWNILLHVIWPSSIFILLIFLIVFLAGKYLGKVTIKEFGPFLLAFAIVGGVVGIAVGSSRAAVVGAVFPAILTVFTLMLGYMFTNESIKEYRIIIPYCLIILMLTALFGLFSGSAIRGKHEKFKRDYEKRLLYYKEVELPLALKKIQNANKANSADAKSRAAD